jgi:ActR/RegA family two-component response regulator
MNTDPESRMARFLLVEDDEDHADLVMRAMRENRVANQISHVRDGEEALKYLRGKPPTNRRTCRM